MTATTPLTYNLYVAEIANLAVVDTTETNGVVEGVDAAFNTLIPTALNYAELRIQRDLDLLPSLTSRTYPLASSANTLALGSDDFVTVQTISVTQGSTTTPLLPVSKEFIQNVWPGTATGVPTYFAMTGGDLATGGNTTSNIIVGPAADANYTATVYGTVRLPTLYQFAVPGDAATETTWISANLPDMLVQASMIIVAQYQRNFGIAAASNDGAMPGSYEEQYQTLLKGALVEENRKKLQASAWSAYSPALIATPTR